MYLYIFEDGEMVYHEDAPTPADMESVEDGVLQVIDLDAVASVLSDHDVLIDKAIRAVSPGGCLYTLPSIEGLTEAMALEGWKVEQIH